MSFTSVEKRRKERGRGENLKWQSFLFFFFVKVADLNGSEVMIKATYFKNKKEAFPSANFAFLSNIFFHFPAFLSNECQSRLETLRRSVTFLYLLWNSTRWRKKCIVSGAIRGNYPKKIYPSWVMGQMSEERRLLAGHPWDFGRHVGCSRFKLECFFSTPCQTRR